MTTSPITGISHADGLWALHGLDRDICMTVVHKTEERLQEHLHDKDVLIGTIQEFKEADAGGIVPCTHSFGRLKVQLIPLNRLE